jgi:DNA-binding transcriptional ArsR family regulator
VQGDERKLPADVAQLLAPHLHRALDHPTRRQILRALNRHGKAQTLADLAVAIPGAIVSTVGYHALVLEECGCISVTVVPSPPDGLKRAYSSNVIDDRVVSGALRATRRLDDLGG